MINKIKNIYVFLFLFIPLFLITGPAIPDIIVSTGVLFGILFLIIKNKEILFFNNHLVITSAVFWVCLLFISFFAINKEKSFQDAFIFLRYLLIPICLYYLYFKNEKVLKYFFFIVFLLIIFVTVDTLFQFFNYSAENGFGSDLLGFKSNWYGRLTGPFGDELIPGSYLSKFGLIGYIYILMNKKINQITFIHTLYLSSILLVCFLSGERMAFATFILALFGLFFFLRNYKIKILISIVIGLILILAIFKLHPFYNDYKVIESKEFHQGLKMKKILNVLIIKMLRVLK